MKAFRTLVNDGRAHENCFKNINMEAFVTALVKPLHRGRMPSENPKAPLLKEDYFYGLSAFSEYIVHGTVPEEESSAIASQQVSTFVDCAPKALIFKLNISEALSSTVETRALRSAKNEAKATKVNKVNEAKPARTKKLIVLVESAPFGRRLDGSLKG